MEVGGAEVGLGWLRLLEQRGGHMHHEAEGGTVADAVAGVSRAGAEPEELNQLLQTLNHPGRKKDAEDDVTTNANVITSFVATSVNTFHITSGLLPNRHTTVEPLLRTPLKKGTPLYKDTISCPATTIVVPLQP